MPQPPGRTPWVATQEETQKYGQAFQLALDMGRASRVARKPHSKATKKFGNWTKVAYQWSMGTCKHIDGAPAEADPQRPGLHHVGRHAALPGSCDLVQSQHVCRH